MPTLMTSVDSSVELSIVLKRRLLLAFKRYAGLVLRRKALEEEIGSLRADISALRDEAGTASLTLEGYKTSLVSPTRKKFNPKKFVALGGDLALYTQAHDEVPGKPYEKVTVPGVEEDEQW